MTLDNVRVYGAVALALVIALNSLANLLLKIGADAGPANGPFGLVAWQTIAGIALFGSAIVAYSYALRHFPLHVAQIVVCVQYVVTIGLAAMVLGEPVSMTKWLGILLISAGLYLCSR